MPYPDNFSAAAYDAAQGRDDGYDCLDRQRGRLRASAHRVAQHHTDINAAVRAILDRALADLDKLDLTGFSLIPGYDLRDVPVAIKDMLPDLDGDLGHRLDEWSYGQMGL